MRSLLLILFLLCAIIAWAAEPKPPEKPSTETRTEEVAPKKGAEQTGVTEKKSPTWPRPYQPSEEISADSVIPFPTDI